MSTTPRLTPAAIAAAIAFEVAKPGQTAAAITSAAIHDGTGFANALENLDTSTPGELEALFRTHQVSAALAERLPENLTFWENKARQRWISNNADAVVESFQTEHDARLKAISPVRETFIEKLAGWARTIRTLKGIARDTEAERRDAAEAQLDSLEWLFENLQAAIDRFAGLPNAENLAGCSGSLGGLDAEIAKLSKAAKS